MPTISARLGEEEKAELDDVADLLSEDRSTTIRKALAENLTTQLQLSDLELDADTAAEL